ncbi:hypothetical protein [Actinoplanes sp. URMC 104]|uniref:hypothetical protein n=1 Tax=Actinoplanes sp. URMC 104 TaxID=3423409 RepID=UPI003F1B409D
MLPFDTVHAITTRLIASADTGLHEIPRPPTLLLLHRRSSRAHRHALQIDVHRAKLAEGYPRRQSADLLRDVARRLSDSHHTPGSTKPLLGASRREVLAAGIGYDTVYDSGGEPTLAYRIQALDIDTRAYELNWRPGESHPSVVVDERADPALTGTLRSLATLLAAVNQGSPPSRLPRTSSPVTASPTIELDDQVTTPGRTRARRGQGARALRGRLVRQGAGDSRHLRTALLIATSIAVLIVTEHQRCRR